MLWKALIRYFSTFNLISISWMHEITCRAIHCFIYKVSPNWLYLVVHLQTYLHIVSWIICTKTLIVSWIIESRVWILAGFVRFSEFKSSKTVNSQPEIFRGGSMTPRGWFGFFSHTFSIFGKGPNFFLYKFLSPGGVPDPFWPLSVYAPATNKINNFPY